MKNKTFDCVQMKQHCLDEIRKKTGSMTEKQEIDFFQKAGDDLKKKIRAAQKASHSKA